MSAPAQKKAPVSSAKTTTGATDRTLNKEQIDMPSEAHTTDNRRKPLDADVNLMHLVPGEVPAGGRGVSRCGLDSVWAAIGAPSARGSRSVKCPLCVLAKELEQDAE